MTGYIDFNVKTALMCNVPPPSPPPSPAGSYKCIDEKCVESSGGIGKEACEGFCLPTNYKCTDGKCVPTNSGGVGKDICEQICS